MIRERDIERRFYLWCRKEGYQCIKLSSPSRRGVPDRMVLGPSGKLIFVELKTPKGKLTHLQRATINTWKGLGHHVCVAHSFEEACDHVNSTFHSA